ncbi:MAG: phosphotransferase family protein [Actinomycetota bacterium]|nr:phosphotransferase family protein [Actinomycetota bacterium]
MSSTLPPLVDELALAHYLDDHLPGSGDLVVERHQAGHSNETFFISRGDRRLVLRRPPRGAFLPSAHDVGREYRVLSALAETSVRVPRTLLMSEDESVIGAQFYVMERVDGTVIRDDLPEVFDEPVRPKLGTELVDALVELHAVDPASCGLETFGKATGYLERQLRRWKGQMELTLPHTRPLPDLEAVGAWLTESLPTSPPTTIVHGDYKLDNVMFRGDGSDPAELVAILDWEMSTLGDPLADLGWMTSFWRERGDDTDDVFARTTRVTELPGFGSRHDLIDCYAHATGRDVTNLGWYQVLAIWKLAILLEGSYARHLAGMTDDPFFAEMEQGVPALARRALDVAKT